jgi:class 3 adenylate cyclase/tetratricopeptide (TPR) repeat protein
VATCGHCGEENPEHARFCLACGSPLAQAEARRERKFATALFADLVGSTALGESEDPEVVQSVVGRAFDRLAEEVDRYGGLLEKFMGDAVLAVFGVPRAHEDDPERAVRAAIEMQAVISELNRGFAAEGKPELAMRIGVEAGDVLVDLERASGPRDRMLTGDAVNTAARLQTAAEPGHVVVGPAVYAATKEIVDYRDLPPLELKGKLEPVPAWDALRIKAKRRGERPSLGLQARLVGRDEELAVLKQTLHRVESEGRPALVTIVGPAGVGKSRLVSELLKHVEGLPQFVYWRNGRCLAYGNTSYSALADAIKAQCEILDDDDAGTAAKKADAAVLELFGDDAVAPHVRALVVGGAERSFTREDLFDAWRRFLERMAARYPLVLVLEDIHWADAGLLDFIEHAADWAQGPILLLTLARPELFETRPTWGGGKRNAASIYLDPLSPDEAGVMVDDLLGGVPPDLGALIVERSEGNPLFAEEIVRALIDDGVLRAIEAARWEVAKPVDAVELPRSIHGLIAARLDGLPEDEKALLQDAAVIGRVFWSGAVARLSGRGDREVRDALGRLRVKEIVLPHEPSSFSDELEFSFRHLLIRDGAYDSLPKALRAEKHTGVARWAEERAGDRADEIAELIATHHLEGLRYLDELAESTDARDLALRDACRWARTAGDRAGALWQLAEASRWYREALRLAEPAGVAVADRAALARSYAQVAWGPEPNEEVERACRAALRLSEEAGDQAGAGWALARMALALFQMGRDEETEAAAREAVARLEPLGESADLSEALHVLGWYCWRRGRLDEAEPLLRRSMAVADRVVAPVAYAQAMQSLALTLVHAGRMDEGVPLIEESFERTKEAGDAALLGRIYNNLPSILADVVSDYPRAEAVLREGLEVMGRTGSRGNLAWLTGSLGDVLTDLGRLAEAEACQREALELARAVSDVPLQGMRLGALAWILMLRGNVDEAERTHRESVAILRENPEPQSEVYVHMLEGYLAAARGRDAEAVANFGRAGEFLVGRMDVAAELEIARISVRRGRSDVPRPRDEPEDGSPLPPAARVRLEVVEGLLAGDAEGSARMLRAAASAFEAMGLRLDHARCLVDVARAEARLGRDPRPTLGRAREILVDCDAKLFIPEVDAAIEEADARVGRSARKPE